jgi:hypothetical protein
VTIRASVRRNGPTTGDEDARRQIRQEVARQVGEATIRRARRRLDGHPAGVEAANAMSVEAGFGQATIVSQHGNPGVIPASRDAQGYSRWGKRFMWWPGARHPVRFVRNYKGLRPLLEAEMSRVSSSEVDVDITIR